MQLLEHHLSCSSALQYFGTKARCWSAMEQHRSFWCCVPTAGCGCRGDAAKVRLVNTIFQTLFSVSSVEPAPGV